MGGGEYYHGHSRVGERELACKQDSTMRGVTMDTVPWGTGCYHEDSTMRERASCYHGDSTMGKTGVTIETVQGSCPLHGDSTGVLPWIQYNGGEGCYLGDSTMRERAVTMERQYIGVGERCYHRDCQTAQ